MSYLTAEEETEIDNITENITIKRGDKSFTIERKNIYGYGLIDLTDDSLDVQLLEEQKWLLDLTPGKVIPVYDYNTSLIKRCGRIIKQSETWSVKDLCKYGHCQLGKPDRIIMFKIKTKGKKSYD